MVAVETDRPFTIAGCARHDAGVLARMAEALRPRRRVRPSVWAEEHITITKRMQAETPQLFRCSFLPWTKCAIDLAFDNPEKEGIVCIKRSQIGYTMNTMIEMASICDTVDQRILYVIGRTEDAKTQARERWQPIIEQVPELAEKFRIGAEELGESLQRYPYQGGQVDMVGAGSPGGVTGQTYQEVTVDEWDQAEANFPSKYGALQPFVLGRFGSARQRTIFRAFSHPTLAGRGIHALWKNESDMGTWVFNCPHCGNPAALTHRCVVFRGGATGLGSAAFGGELDPDFAVLECSRCGKEITDRQRQREVWPGELGGSGRRWTELDKPRAAARRYAGLAINGLCDPYKTVRFFAVLLAAARRGGNKALQSTVNTAFGEAYEPAEAPMTAEVLRAVMRPAALGARVSVPGGRLGCRFVTVGCDVQSPRENPTLYVWAAAWACNGLGYVFDLRRLSGWAAMFAQGGYLTRLSAHVEGGTENGEAMLGVRGLGIDAGYLTSHVLDQCRGTLYSEVSGARIDLVPLKYEPKLNADKPVEIPREDKRLHPTRPELGLLDRYSLHRHTFVDRILRRVQEKRIVMIPDEYPNDFESQMNANVLRPVQKLHNLAPDAMEWYKPDELRDDWMQAGAFSEALAAVKYGLDSMHMSVTDAPMADDAPKIFAPKGIGRRF